MRTPDVWPFILVSLAAFRVYRLVAHDVITRPLRVRLVRRAEVDGTVYIGGKPYRPVLDEFLHCPWCVGAWVAAGWWAAWLVWPHATVLVAAPWAVSAVVGLVAKNLDR